MSFAAAPTSEGQQAAMKRPSTLTQACSSHAGFRNKRTFYGAGECLFLGKSGRAADITAMADFDPKKTSRGSSP
jgi:hypothetical protein